mgnify:CR=1 FL=1
MFQLTGRIYTINVISDKSIQIVIKKTIRGKQVLIAVNIFGKWKYEADKLKLKKNDKITGVLFINSHLYKGKFYNDISFEKIEKYIEKPKPQKEQPIPEHELFYGISNKVIINEETGKPYF